MTTETTHGAPTGGTAKDAGSASASEPESFTAAPVPGLLQSPTIGKLIGALSKAQGELKAPGKGKTAKITGDKGYSYNYADLADVIECFRGPLTKHGLSITQPIVQRDGHMVLFTVLAHESGEWMASDYPLKVYDRPQEQGSAITYARRYAVSSLLGIAAEDDDDGKRAQDAQPAQQPVSADAAAILDVAAELEQIVGVDAATLTKEASKFSTDEGDERWFSDPTEGAWILKAGTKTPQRAGTVTPKWMKGTREKLERDLRKHVKDEPGAAEAASLFTDRPA